MLNRHSLPADLLDQNVVIDRRMLDYIVGLQPEMEELVQGSYLITPKAHLDQLVLPQEQKEAILTTVNNYHCYYQQREKLGLEDIQTTATLVLLLYGPSGTGKTFTVNAIASELNKKVLLVNFEMLTQRPAGLASDVKGLFREAELHNAVLFFDECDGMFAQRGGSCGELVTMLLTSLESSRVMVCLATNRAFDLDEAMHRRITAAFEILPPDFIGRRELWRIHAEQGSVQTDDSIDWGKIALKYELSGGFIKNAMLSALMAAVARDHENPLISEEDITQGCRLQMRGSLQMRQFSNRVVPTGGLDEMIIGAELLQQLKEVVAFEKARSVLFGAWGFSEVQRKQQGVCGLFHGPAGSGKQSAAEAISWEIGKPVKLVSCLSILGPARKDELLATFSDGKIMEAVLVIQDCEALLIGEDCDSNSREALLSCVAEFPGVCILIASYDPGVASAERILHENKSIIAQLKFSIRFGIPKQDTRVRLWQHMIPSKCPREEDIDLVRLASDFEFSSGQICASVMRAASLAALRANEDERKLTMHDLLECSRQERDKTDTMYDQLSMGHYV
eukprot:TRINITY_DN8907_c0_g1_i1.p1 TRINITY_DN8907_c0_g1~~TRINITY_DN8907_c0_g1_i1.p1  ORF type:complete len:564 (+),score=179.60 TRINITY_DN8907_c0_g1_i1:32-1723(+)